MIRLEKQNTARLIRITCSIGIMIAMKNFPARFDEKHYHNVRLKYQTLQNNSCKGKNGTP